MLNITLNSCRGIIFIEQLIYSSMMKKNIKLMPTICTYFEFIYFTPSIKAPSTLATLFSHRWPRFCGGPEHTRATCGGEWQVSYPTEWLPHATRTIACVLAAERRTQPQKRSVCGGDEPQPVAHLSHKLQYARQSLKIMVSYGNKYPRHKNAATWG